MLDYGVKFVRKQGTDHVKEVSLVELAALVDLGRHIWHRLRPRGELFVEALDGHLRIVAHAPGPHL